MSAIYQHLIGSLYQHMVDFAASESIPVTKIAFENNQFDPPDGGIWFRVITFFGQTIQATVGDGGYNRIEGSFLISVFYDKGKPAGPLNEMVDKVMAYFKRGTDTPLVSSQKVRVLSASRENLQYEEKWVQVPVRIRFYTEALNS